MIKNEGPAVFDGYFVNKSFIVSESNSFEWLHVIALPCVETVLKASCHFVSLLFSLRCGHSFVIHVYIWTV